MTFDDFLAQGRITSRMAAYRSKRDKALEVVKAQLATHERPYVSVSGGKDSVACACLVDTAARAMGKDYVLWAHVSDACFPGTEETIDALADKLQRKIIYSRSEGSAYEALKYPERKAFGKTGVFFDSIRDFVKSSGSDLCFTGTRAYESRRRMTAAKCNGSCFHSDTGGGIDICNPLAWFRLEDVAAVLWEYDAPIHPIYRKAALGTDSNRFGEDKFIRLGYITSRDLLNKGTAVFIKVNYPEQWAKLCEAYPEARNYC